MFLLTSTPPPIFFCQHHFWDNQFGGYSIFESFAEADDELAINLVGNLDQKHTWWTLEQKKSDFQLVQGWEGSKNSLAKFMNQMGMRNPPITPSQPWDHNLDLIHFVEGTCRNVVKLFVMDVSPCKLKKEYFENNTFEKNKILIEKENRFTS